MPKSHGRVPGIWEKQQAVILAAPAVESIRPSKFHNGPKTVEEVQANMIKALTPHVHVWILYNGEKQLKIYKKRIRKHGVKSFKKLRFIPTEHCDIWCRDICPIWMINGKFPIAGLVPRFLLWGYLQAPGGKSYVKGPWASCDVPNTTPMFISRATGIPMFGLDYIGEGGDKSFNGKGCLICAWSVEKQRNPGLSKKQVTDLLKRSFHQKKIIWVDKGVFDDKQSFHHTKGEPYTLLGTGGHIDEFCRFVGPRTILLAYVSKRQQKMSQEARITHKRMEHNLRLLRRQTDQNGKHFKIVRMPLPDPIIMEITAKDQIYTQLRQMPKLDPLPKKIKVALASGYINYCASNRVVLLPKYYKKGRPLAFKETDAEAKRTLQKVFPKHKIVQINPEPVNAGGGGLNCISNNVFMPKKR